MFDGLHKKLLAAQIFMNLKTKILVALVFNRMDNYSGEFKEVRLQFYILNNKFEQKLEKDHYKDDITLASREIDIRSEEYKSLIELIANQKIDSNNTDAIEDEVTFSIFKFNDLEVTFICSNGEQKCDPWILRQSSFFSHKLKTYQRLDNKPKFDYSMYSKACIKLYIDALQETKIKSIPREKVLEMLDFLKFEGKSGKL